LIVACHILAAVTVKQVLLPLLSPLPYGFFALPGMVAGTAHHAVANTNTVSTAIITASIGGE